ncbi:MAG: 50S ribosomal protein L35 [Planctomycetia bacterium]|nr:50S ribosomal protein L35 [Planctomycetia bacterium]
MPKMKSNRSIAKRFRVTKKGKVKRYRAGGSHLNSHKRASRKRKLRKSGTIQGRQAVTYRRMLGGI